MPRFCETNPSSGAEDGFSGIGFAVDVLRNEATQTLRGTERLGNSLWILRNEPNCRLGGLFRCQRTRDVLVAAFEQGRRTLFIVRGFWRLSGSFQAGFRFVGFWERQWQVFQFMAAGLKTECQIYPPGKASPHFSLDSATWSVSLYAPCEGNRIQTSISYPYRSFNSRPDARTYRVQPSERYHRI